MDTSGEAADLVVKESIQLTEASIKLLAAGSKKIFAAFYMPLPKIIKKLVGKTSMNRLLRGKELKSFCIKEEDFAEFRKYARPNVLFAAVQDTKANDGLVALVTNTDFRAAGQPCSCSAGVIPPPTEEQEEPAAKKKDAPLHSTKELLTRARNGSTASRTSQTMRTTDTAEKISDIPTVKGRLAVLQKTALKCTEHHAHLLAVQVYIHGLVEKIHALLKYISPEVGSSRRFSERSIVVPEPDGPIIATTSPPRLTSMLQSSSAFYLAVVIFLFTRLRTEMRTSLLFVATAHPPLYCLDTALRRGSLCRNK